MSIATSTHTTHAPVRVTTAVRPATARRRVQTPAEQLRDMRSLIRHFVLAFTGAAAVMYAVVAAGGGL